MFLPVSTACAVLGKPILWFQLLAQYTVYTQQLLQMGKQFNTKITAHLKFNPRFLSVLLLFVFLFFFQFLVKFYLFQKILPTNVYRISQDARSGNLLFHILVCYSKKSNNGFRVWKQTVKDRLTPTHFQIHKYYSSRFMLPCHQNTGKMRTVNLRYLT